jgi:septum formation protein
MHFDRPIILASKSPRRSQLLRESGFNFTVVGFDTDESFPEDMPAEDVAPMLAQRKARAGAHLIQDQEIILAADSVVILEGEVFNKPTDFDDAFRMLSRLSGNCHTVVTGVCLLSKTKEKVMAGVTKVWFAPLSETEIRYYIDTYKPYDKAGAYGAQEWIGHCKIVRIEGTYPNVMGLPVDLVYQGLAEFSE